MTTRHNPRWYTVTSTIRKFSFLGTWTLFSQPKEDFRTGRGSMWERAKWVIIITHIQRCYVTPVWMVFGMHRLCWNANMPFFMLIRNHFHHKPGMFESLQQIFTWKPAQTSTKYSVCSVFALCITALINQQHCDLHSCFVIKCKIKHFLNRRRQPKKPN